METGPVAASASAPTHPEIELEPPQWQPRIMWVTARALCGAASFFFVSFVFAYFYLRSLDTNKDWKIGTVNAPVGWGLVILVVLILSAVALRGGVGRPDRFIPAAATALGLGLLSVVLQVIEWTTLGFGPESGGYASVFIGWTVMYAFFTLPCMYWIETQLATAWRRQRDRPAATSADVSSDTLTLGAAFSACSFFWNFYVFNGVVAFVILYLL